MRIQFTIVAEPKKPVSRVRIAPSSTSSSLSSPILPGVAATGWRKWRGGKGETSGAHSQHPGTLSIYGTRSKPDANQRVDTQMCTELAYDVYPTTHMAEMQDAVAQRGRN